MWLTEVWEEESGVRKAGWAREKGKQAIYAVGTPTSTVSDNSVSALPHCFTRIISDPS